MKVIKIFSHPGLVQSSFEQPGPGYLRLWRLNYIPVLAQYWFIARDIWRLLLSLNLNHSSEIKSPRAAENRLKSPKIALNRLKSP